MSKKLICYSLWGNHEFYNYGALENAIIAQTLYPGWICRYYYIDNCDNRIIEQLKKMPNVELVKMDITNDNITNMMWRFKPCFEENDVIYLCRDADSRLNIKEKLAVDDWLASNKDFHIMRDHEYHGIEIVGASWGCRNNILKPLKNDFDLALSTTNKRERDYDQDFLKDVIYPKIKNNLMVHASHHKIEPFAKDFPPCDYDGYIAEYIRTAPHSFKLLGEKDRFLNTYHKFQEFDS
jgi:hypothetical protein